MLAEEGDLKSIRQPTTTNGDPNDATQDPDATATLTSGEKNTNDHQTTTTDTGEQSAESTAAAAADGANGQQEMVQAQMSTMKNVMGNGSG